MENKVLQHYSSQLHKSDQRKSLIQADHKCLLTFPFINYKQENKNACLVLPVINEVSVAPQKKITFPYRHQTELLIPIAGALSLEHNGIASSVKPEEAVYFSGNKQHTYSIQNPYEAQWISYLHIGLNSAAAPTHNTPLIVDTALKINSLISLQLENAVPGAFACTGIYTGCAKETYTLKNKNNTVFLYVINGSFEAENRLLEYRDALSLWNAETVELQALAAHSILLLFEVPCN